MVKKIYGNERLNELKVEISENLKKYTIELETVNNEHNPSYVKLKKRKDNIIYYLTLTFFLFLIISLCVIFRAVEAFYFILILYGINLLLSGSGIFLLIIVNKKLKIIKESWDKKLNEIKKYQIEASKLYQEAETEIYKVIALTNNHETLEKLDGEKYLLELENKIKEVKVQIKKELGSGYNSEAVYQYYEEWGKKLTDENDDFDFLEARRKSALLKSQKI